jgi:hypothetical protein
VCVYNRYILTTNNDLRPSTAPLDLFSNILVATDGIYRLSCQSEHKFGDPGPRNVVSFESVHFPGMGEAGNLKSSGSEKLAKIFSLKFPHSVSL